MALTNTWDSAFEASPAGTDDPSVGDDKIRQVKAAVRERAEKEHYWRTAESSSIHGWHREGSAKAYYEADAPSKRPDGSTNLTASDNGRLWVNSDTGLLYAYVHPNWVGMVRTVRVVSIQGTLAAATNIVPPIVVTRNCTITKVSIRVGTAPTGASLIVDINKYGTDEVADGSIFNGVTRPTITSGNYENNVTLFSATYSDMAAGEYLTVDIDQVGSTVAGADLTIAIEMRFD